jgi:hypothetical protein
MSILKVQVDSRSHLDNSGLKIVPVPGHTYNQYSCGLVSCVQLIRKWTVYLTYRTVGDIPDTSKEICTALFRNREISVGRANEFFWSKL